MLDTRGPAFYSEDLGILKRVSVGTRDIEFRADFINLFNRVGLGGPITNLSDPNFGRIFGIGMGSRRIQLSLRATF